MVGYDDMGMKKNFFQLIITAIVTLITRIMDRLLLIAGQGPGAGIASQETVKAGPYSDIEYKVWLLKRTLTWYGYKRMAY